MTIALIVIVGVLALALVASTWATGRALRRMLDKFADQTERMIAQTDERVKGAYSESEKAYMAFHAAASPGTFPLFRSMGGGGLVGAKYPTKKHYKEKAEARQPTLPLNGHTNGVHSLEPIEALSRKNQNVVTTLDIDELQNGGRT